MPQVFGVPTVTDGIGMGTEGMKYSLVSREVIADAIETSVNGQCMDGVLVAGGCDKNMPAGCHGARADEPPGHFRLRGHDQAGRVEGQAAHHRFAVRGGRRVCRGQDGEGRLRRHRAQRLSECRRLRRHVHGEHHVVVVRGARHQPPRQLADGLARRREGRFRGRIGARAGRGGQARPEAARHHHAQIDRERDRAGDGDRRLDQRGASLSRHRVRRRGAVDDRRFRADHERACRCSAT